MINVFDVGSMPPKATQYELREGAKHYQSLARYTRFGAGYELADRFERFVVDGLIDKLRAGIDVPSYPQFRDMNEMFLDLIEGVKHTPKGYVAFSKLSCKPSITIPEVQAIRSNLREISETPGIPEVKLKICVTGPYTLSTLFASRTPELINELGEVLREITINSVFKVKGCRTALLAIDEPAFGLIDDPLMDLGYTGREYLKQAWSKISSSASSRGLETMIHLHSTSDSLMWDVEGLDIIGSHVGDPIYSPSTKARLDATGKRLSVSVAETQFDGLIQKVARTPEELGEVWSKINKGTVNPELFLDAHEVISGRLHKSLELFGEDYIPYAGPECGLGGFPTYDCAVSYLGRISSAVKSAAGV